MKVEEINERTSYVSKISEIGERYAREQDDLNKQWRSVLKMKKKSSLAI